MNLAPAQTSSPSVTGMSVWLPVYPDLAIKGAFFSFAGVTSRYLAQTDKNALEMEKFQSSKLFFNFIFPLIANTLTQGMTFFGFKGSWAEGEFCIRS